MILDLDQVDILKVIETKAVFKDKAMIPFKEVSILIVDDDEDIRNYFNKILKNNYSDLTFTSNGIEALANASFNKPDIIFLDLNLPGINGDKVLKLLRKNSRTCDIPIIAITKPEEKNLNKTKLKLRQTGFDEVQFKPLDRFEVYSKIIKFT